MVRTMEVYCSMCGKEKAIPLNTVNKDTTVENIIQPAGWIVQQNGPHLDVYCSQKCAR
jgi:cytochrome c1